MVAASHTYGCSLGRYVLQLGCTACGARWAGPQLTCSSLAVRPLKTRAGGRASPWQGMRTPVMGSTTFARRRDAASYSVMGGCG